AARGAAAPAGTRSPPSRQRMRCIAWCAWRWLCPPGPRVASTGGQVGRGNPNTYGSLAHQDELAVVGDALAVGLVAVAHDGDALELRDRGVGIALLEGAPELGVEVDFLVDPGVERAARAQHDDVLRDEGVALAVADRALGRRRAPGVLQRVPAQAALPGDVDGCGRVAVTAEALEKKKRQRDGAPRPAQLPALLVRPVEGVAH